MILRILTDILASLLAACEAKLHSVKHHVADLATGVIMLCVGACLGLVSVLLLLTAMFAAITHVLGVAIAALLTGGAALIVAGAIAGIGISRMR